MEALSGEERGTLVEHEPGGRQEPLDGRPRCCRSTRSGIGASQLEESLDLPERILCDLLDNLLETGFILATGQPPTYKPAREPEKIMLADLLSAVKEAGGSWKPLRLTDGEAALQTVLFELDTLTASRIAGLNIKDMVMQKTG